MNRGKTQDVKLISVFVALAILQSWTVLFGQPLLAASGPIFEQPQQTTTGPSELRPTVPNTSAPQGAEMPIETPSTAYILNAERTVRLTLKEAFEQAEEHNPEILKARQDVSLATASVVTAGARPNPQLAVQMGFGPAWTRTIAGNTQQVGVNQIIETGGKRAARINYSKAQQTASNLQLEAIRFDIRIRIRRAYAELAAAQAYTQLIENLRALAERLVNIASERFKAGAAAEAEIIQAQLTSNQYDAQRNSAQGRIRQAQIQLSTLLGQPVAPNLVAEDQGLFRLQSAQSEIVPAADQAMPDEDTLLQSALSNRPDLRVAEQQLTVSTKQFRLARAQRIPDVILGSGFAFTTFKRPEPQQFGGYVNVNVDLPIFYRKQGEIMSAKVSIDQAKTQTLIARNRLIAEVKAAFENVRLAKANIAKYRTQLLAAATETVHLNELGYQYGRNRLADVILAQQSMQQINVGYFEAVIAYQNAWSDLEKAVGRPLTF
jgi:cobalt-zinc-cadmium efflux system outer membrane protein